MSVDTIMDTARAAFLRDGVAGAGIQRIALDAQVSVGGLYHHFADKRGLAAAVHDRALERYQRAVMAVLDEHEDAEAGVRAVVGTHLRWCLHDQPDDAAFLLLHPDAAGAVTDGNRAFFSAVLRWWRPHVRYGAMRDLDFDLAYALWLGPAQEYCRLWIGARTAVEPEDAVTPLADAAWAALKGA